MKVILHYNDFTKDIDIDFTKKNGILQESLLNYCSLMIYNIENTEIVLKKKIEDITENINLIESTESYILGSDELDFNNTLEKITNDYIIIKIIIYDRKRDKDGNVIKDNYIIDRYNKWYQINEDENYISNFSSSTLNRHILRFPLTTLLTSILNIPINELIPPTIQENTEEAEDTSDEIAEDTVNTSDETVEDTVDKSDEIVEDTVDTSDEIAEDISDKIVEDTVDTSNEIAEDKSGKIVEDTEDKSDETAEDTQTENDVEDENNSEVLENNNLANQNYSRLNNLINIFDDYINMSNNLINDSFINRLETDINSMNNIFMYPGQSSDIQTPSLLETIPNLTISPDQPLFGTTYQSQNQYRTIPLYYDFNDTMQLTSLMSYYVPNNQTQLQEDVKIVLNDIQFNNLKTINYSELDSDHECLICLDKFNESDNIKKITCNHIFHNNCIKSWLCEESNKCPICRIEIDKGNPKDL